MNKKVTLAYIISTKIGKTYMSFLVTIILLLTLTIIICISDKQYKCRILQKNNGLFEKQIVSSY